MFWKMIGVAAIVLALGTSLALVIFAVAPGGLLIN
jgi:hypothetical protein